MKVAHGFSRPNGDPAPLARKRHHAIGLGSVVVALSALAALVYTAAYGVAPPVQPVPPFGVPPSTTPVQRVIVVRPDEVEQTVARENRAGRRVAALAFHVPSGHAYLVTEPSRDR